jgi:hypothetical protein
MKITQDDIGKMVNIVGGLQGKICPPMFGTGKFNVVSSNAMESVDSNGTRVPRGDTYVISFAETFETELIDWAAKGKFSHDVSAELIAKYVLDSLWALRSSLRRALPWRPRTKRSRKTTSDLKLSKLLLKYELGTSLGVTNEVLHDYVKATVLTFIRTVGDIR